MTTIQSIILAFHAHVFARRLRGFLTLSRLQVSRFSLPSLVLLTLLMGMRLGWAAGTIVSTTVECNLPSTSNTVSQYSAVCRYNGSTYAVANDASGRPFITKVSSTGTTSGYIDLPDLMFATDGHCAFSIGIDKLGYIHVAGGMHQGWPETTTIVPRYQNPDTTPKMNMMYWRSNQPENVTSGFTFLGIPYALIPASWPSSTTVPGEGWQDTKFITDVNGELYCYSMVNPFARTAFGMGDKCIGFYHYNTANQIWTALGGEVDHTTPYSIAPYYKALFWEYQDDGWQNFQCTFQFDNWNRLHFTTSCDSDVNGNLAPARLYYAYSDDSGNTWHKASGASIPGLPLRGDIGNASQADLVTTQLPGGLSVWQSVVVDPLRNPIVGGGGGGVWYAWNGSTWSSTNALGASGAVWGRQGQRGVDNNMYFCRNYFSHILWTSGANFMPLGYQCIGYDAYLCLDEMGLRNTGVLYGIGTTSSGESVLKTTITPAPLPTGWNDFDIGSALGWQGFSGFQNGAFVVNDYGNYINNQTDSLHFTSTPLTGDGQIVAHFISKVGGNSSLALSGIMMRETMDIGSRAFTLCSSPGGQIMFAARNNPNDWYSSRYFFGSTNTWFKLVRAGSTFTAYTSADGNAWSLVNTATITMAPTINVGLSTAGYMNGGGMQTSTFDNVSVTTLLNDTSSYVAYGSGWTYYPNHGNGDYNNDVHYTTGNGSYATFTFTGSQVSYITEKYSDEGNVDVYIDGVFDATVNCYAPTRLVQQNVYTKTWPLPGPHTIEIVKNSGTYMLLDAFTFVAGPQVLNDTSSYVAYGAGWTYYPNHSIGNGDYNNDVHYTTGNGNYSTFTFTGSQVSYITEKYSDEGNVDVYIDGVFDATVNCYAPTRLMQQNVYSKGWAVPGTHTIKVVKNSGTYMLLDALTFQ